MGIGSGLRLALGLAFQSFGQRTPFDWGIIAWLGSVNTAFAFVLWNNTLRSVTATESSALNSPNLPQVAILSVVFLGEQLSLKEIAGLTMVFAGAITVQMRLKRRMTVTGK